jgi:CARDB protein
VAASRNRAQDIWPWHNPPLYTHPRVIRSKRGTFMRLMYWGPLLFAALFSWAPHLAVAQTGEYTVTATLNPRFTHPDTGFDLTWQGPIFDTGLVRGADGYLYTIRTDYGRAAAVTQINPATGVAKDLYVFTQAADITSWLVRGQGGRLYFTVEEGVDVYSMYVAPGYTEDIWCSSGCVLYVDSANGGHLKELFEFNQWPPVGDWPEFGVEFEDTDGAVYVSTTADSGHSGVLCDNGAYDVAGTLVKITFEGEGTLLEKSGCPDEPKFDWSTVTSSGNDIWHWTDGRRYFISGQNIYQHDPATGMTVLLATIAISDGVPQRLSEASGYLYGVTGGGGALNGGVVFRTRVPSLASPDLTITGLSNPPPTAPPGALFTVSDTTLNNGPEPAALSRNAYYLSANGTHRDIRLVNGRYVPELWPAQESFGDRSVKIPATTPPGMYWLMACADTDLQVAESDDTNNCRVADSRVTIGYPDLRQTNVNTVPEFASPGGKIVVNDTVDNPTLVTTPASTTRYYLSLNVTKDAGDILLTGKRAIPELAPSEVNSANATITLPLAVPDGAYYVLACADDLIKIKEASETNNCATSATTLRVGWADLVTTTISDPPATALRGSKFTVSDTARNQGTIPAVASTTRYYLSVDAVKNTGDVVLMGVRAVAALEPSASSPGGRLVTVPLTTPVGLYYVLACADDTGKVTESDNANNCRSSATTVEIQ